MISHPRPSTLSSTSTSTPDLTPTQLRLLEKQQEYASLQALREASGLMLVRVEELARMSHVMADGGAAVGSVLRNWNQVFSILNLFDKPPTSQSSEPNPQTSSNSESTSRAHPSSGPVEGETTVDPRARVEGEDEEEEELPLLVRLQFDKYQSQTQEQGQAEEQAEQDRSS